MAFYQKYGSTAIDPAKGLTEATGKVTESLNGVMGTIKSLMENQQNQIIAANTLEAQDIFKQRIKETGLGILSEPIDTDVITKRYGNMVDKDTVTKTIASQTDLLKNAALNSASSVANAHFEDNESLTGATKAYRQNLIDANAPAALADELTRKWSTEQGTALASNLTAFKTETNNNAAANTIDIIRKSDAAPADAIKLALSDVKEKHRPEAEQAAVAALEKAGAPRLGQTSQLATVHTHLDNQNKMYQQEIMIPVEKTETAYKALPGVDSSVLAQAAKYDSTTPAGTAGAIADASRNGWFKGLFRLVDLGGIAPKLFGDPESTGNASAKLIEDHAATLKTRYPNLTREQLKAIGLAAFQDNITSNSANKIGVAIDDPKVIKSMDDYAQQEALRAPLYKDYLEKKRTADNLAAQSSDNLLREKQAFSDKLMIGNIKGNGYNPVEDYEKNYNKRAFAATASTLPTTDEPKDPETTKKSTINKILGVTPVDITKPSGTGLAVGNAFNTTILGNVPGAAPPSTVVMKPKVEAVVNKTLADDPGSVLTKRLFAVINKVESDNSDNPNLTHRNADGSVANAKGAFGTQVKNFVGGPTNAEAHSLDGQAKMTNKLANTFAKDLVSKYKEEASEENILLALRHGARGASILLKAEREGKSINELPRDIRSHILNNEGKDVKGYMAKTRATFKSQLNAASQAGY